ncbi:unnamed protein product [Trichobilharzia regenti]|uniref:BZIP domain-containing protein n=1 Tax=Trichobilharzia regenti TaxID=157069 RepID=A0A183VST9_TRIRE|nr:unnamed protein product [Trichobilharzia regenti]VDP99424.1 unnamed protein product [Trichobilharzia regenti]
MEVPFTSDVFGNFHVREARQNNTQVVSFPVIHQAFPSSVYSSLQPVTNSVTTDFIKQKNASYDTNSTAQVVQPVSLCNFNQQQHIINSMAITPPVTYSAGACSQPGASQSYVCSVLPSTSAELEDYIDAQTLKRKTRGRSCKHGTKSSSSFDDKPVSLSTKDSQVSSSDCNSDCSAATGSSERAKTSNKDERYILRRLRNNLAAKRSRDNRKRREDTIALRAKYLEKSNLVLQTQILALKREVCLLRGIPFDPNYKVQVLNDNFASSNQATTQSSVLCEFPNDSSMLTFSPMTSSNHSLNSNTLYTPITEFSGN